MIFTFSYLFITCPTSRGYGKQGSIGNLTTTSHCVSQLNKLLAQSSYPYPLKNKLVTRRPLLKTNIISANLTRDSACINHISYAIIDLVTVSISFTAVIHVINFISLIINFVLTEVLCGATYFPSICFN
jgi:hypothetical protein